MTTPQSRPIGLREAIAAYRSARGPWSEEKCDIALVFNDLCADRRTANALAREAAVMGDKPLCARVAGIVAELNAELTLRLSNWQPTDWQVERPQ